MPRMLLVVGMVIVGGAGAFEELGGRFPASLDHPAIRYHAASQKDPVAELNRKIQEGLIRLKFAGSSGYLRSVLEALEVPIESQMAVFSKTSLQADRISPYTPRTIFFSDSVVVAWMRGGFIELAAHDPEQGVIFYTLQQTAAAEPAFERDDSRCLRCHASEASLGVPGMVVRSIFTAPDGSPRLIYGAYTSDHRSALEERWGGWYVTGDPGPNRHLGNAMIDESAQPESIVTERTLRQESLAGKIDGSAYLSPYSDIAALMVFDHQMHMTNLLTRVAWEVRLGFYRQPSPNLLLTLAPDKRRTLGDLLTETATELVDYMLFVDEAPLSGRIRGGSGFAERFAAIGPRDSQGRSLRQLDLSRRLMRYPCSYMIYSQAFENLPSEAKGAIYRRMWDVLSGAEKSDRYARLAQEDRGAIVGILRETKTGLPDYFR